MRCFCADADLLWFGGIGTYVKATNETHADAGDRANDACASMPASSRSRSSARAPISASRKEARIEFALNGGRINTDAVDNSAGVNSSDIEVNIKIGLSRAEAAKRLTREDRNTLLADMTDDVAGLVLRNNYLQTLCLSLALEQGTDRKQLCHAAHAAAREIGRARPQASSICPPTRRSSSAMSRAAG